MVLHKSSSQQGSQGWAPDSVYGADSERSSSPFRSNKLHGLEVVHKVSPIASSTDDSIHLQDLIRDTSMSAINVTSPWPTLRELGHYGSEDYQDLPPEHYSSPLDAMDFDYARPATNVLPYAYQYPSNFPGADPTSNCPRTFSNDFDVTSFSSKDPEAGGYPPTSYLVDPGKNDLYISATSHRTSDRCSFIKCEEESAPSQCTEDDGNQSSQNLVFPASSLSSMPSDNAKYLTNTDTTFAKNRRSSESERLKDDETDPDENEPYAKLIYRALLSKPDHRMVLKEIYEWFALNTDKNKDPSQRGWQNSIRHNLSMNGAFRKVEQDSSADDSKKGFVWVLEDSAISEGVKSTTRYRKTGSSKKGPRSESPALQRQVSGRKGGQAAKRVKTAKSRQLEKLERGAKHVAMTSASEPESCTSTVAPGNNTRPEYGSEASSLVSHIPPQPLTPESVSEDYCYPYFIPSAATSAQLCKVEQQHCIFSGIAGVVDNFSGEPLFCDSSGTADESVAGDLSFHSPISVTL